jgi:hypothetical protein
MSLGTDVVAVELCSEHVLEAATFFDRHRDRGKHASLDIIPDLIRDAAIGKEPAYKAAAGVDLKDVRQWAKADGVPVPERGRIAGEVIQQYKVAVGTH